MSGTAAHFQSHDVENKVESRLFLPFRTVSLSITSSIVGISFWSCSFFARSTCMRTARLRSCWSQQLSGNRRTRSDTSRPQRNSSSAEAHAASASSCPGLMLICPAPSVCVKPSPLLLSTLRAFLTMSCARRGVKEPEAKQRHECLQLSRSGSAATRHCSRRPAPNHQPASSKHHRRRERLQDAR